MFGGRIIVAANGGFVPTCRLDRGGLDRLSPVAIAIFAHCAHCV